MVRSGRLELFAGSGILVMIPTTKKIVPKPDVNSVASDILGYSFVPSNYLDRLDSYSFSSISKSSWIDQQQQTLKLLNGAGETR
jgi:hypothetical protein